MQAIKKFPSTVGWCSSHHHAGERTMTYMVLCTVHVKCRACRRLGLVSKAVRLAISVVMSWADCLRSS